MSELAKLLQHGEDAVYAGQFAQGEAAARHVIGQSPGTARAHYILAISSLFQNRHADALAHVEKAVELDGAESQFHFTKGVCLAAVGRPAEAIHAYRRALELRPMFFEARANLGNLLETAQRFDEAAEQYSRALRMKPDVVPVLNGLGVSEIAMGRFEDAVRHLQRALSLQPDFATAHNNIASAYGKLKQGEKAIEHLRRAVAIRPDFADAWISLGEQLYMAGRDKEAVPCLDRALAIDPDNEGIRYLRDSIAGVKVGRAPDTFVRDFFDRFAADFDKRLTVDLEYRTPQEFIAFLEPVFKSRPKMRIADLGCGTGLSGILLRPHASYMVGVDLSGKMLEKARERAVFDELAEMEVAAFLEGREAASFDLVTAVDVFVYVGDLAPVFRASRHALPPRGLFAFSVERLDGAGEGEDFRLARTGRYAHSDAYVKALAAKSGCALVDERDTVLRKEDGKPVHGRLYLFEMLPG
ncbi:tetratricopeptide repeat protein [Usitatibacter palustris]|uniref:Lipopolysaccharide assembly protein B n=1 Tax=Usitatibacter palustris TaxID=2732487 RepID=A0A6M4HD33_9PROT|nr:tetratricopeptide repeat protein [Usitatibacter palustris]QJR16453.1 Lipopolysaccharide assembly protein B [Usitatibacter palustris]